MILYLDTSAIVPILIVEPSTAVCRRLWDDADRRVSSRVTYVETAAALSMAQRLGRVSIAERDAAWSNFVDIWPRVNVVELAVDLTVETAEFTRQFDLRGYDAVHCASAAAVNDPTSVAAAGDRRLLAALQSVGMAVINTNAA